MSLSTVGGETGLMSLDVNERLQMIRETYYDATVRPCLLPYRSFADIVSSDKTEFTQSLFWFSDSLIFM